MSDGLLYLGAEGGMPGFDYGALLQTAGGLIQGGVAIAEEEQAKGEQAADTRKKQAAAIAADIELANALAIAAVSAQLKSKSAKADADAAQKASSAADRAGADLPPELMQARSTAADKALVDAVARAKAKPKDGYLAAVVKAWMTVATKVHGAGTASVEAAKAGSTESWFTRPVLGGLPGYGIVIGGVVLLGGIGFAVKKIFF